MWLIGTNLNWADDDGARCSITGLQFRSTYPTGRDNLPCRPLRECNGNRSQAQSYAGVRLAASDG